MHAWSHLLNYTIARRECSSTFTTPSGYATDFHELNHIKNQIIPSSSDIHISVSEGLRVSPATVDAVDIVNEKHSCPGSDTSSDVIVIGIHCILASSLSVKLSLRPVKSSVAKKGKKVIYRMIYCGASNILRETPVKVFLCLLVCSTHL